AAALLLQQLPAATSGMLFSHMQQTAQDVWFPGRDVLTGPGLLQVIPFSLGGGGGGPAGGTQTAYVGDLFEPNDTSDQAASMGLLTQAPQAFFGLAITNHSNGLPDQDWYRWTAGQNGSISIGIQYSVPGGDLH